jgi:hypothetical protein
MQTPGTNLTAEQRKFAWVLGTPITLMFLYGLYRVLPALVSMAQNTLMLLAYCVAIAVVFYVTVLDSGLRNMLANFWRRIIRFLYVLSFNVDPIGGLKTRIQELREANAKARERAADVKGQVQALQTTIDQNQQVVDDGLQRMQAAQSRGKREEALAESIKVGAAKEANKPLSDLKRRIETMYVQLGEIIHKSDLKVDVLSTVVTVKERTYKATKAGRSAMRSAMAAFRGDTAKDELFQMNLDWVDDFASTAIGEMEALPELYKDALGSVDLQQMSFSDDAFRMLEERQGKVAQLMDSDVVEQQSQRMLASPVPPLATPAEPAHDLSRFLKQ